MVRAGGLMVMPRALVAVALDESLTWTVKVLAPDVVGVPMIAPPGSRDRPAGRAPVTIDH